MLQIYTKIKSSKHFFKNKNLFFNFCSQKNRCCEQDYNYLYINIRQSPQKTSAGWQVSVRTISRNRVKTPQLCSHGIKRETISLSESRATCLLYRALK